MSGLFNFGLYPYQIQVVQGCEWTLQEAYVHQCTSLADDDDWIEQLTIFDYFQLFKIIATLENNLERNPAGKEGRQNKAYY